MRIWLERQRYLVDYAASSIWRRKAKTGLLWFVYVVLVFALASVILFGSAVRREANIVLQGAPDLVAQGMRMGRHEFAVAGDVEKLQKLRGADRVEARLWGYHYDTASASNYTLQVPSTYQPGYRVDPGETMIGEGVARLRKLAPGSYLFLVSPTGKLLKEKVKAILPQELALVSADLVLLSEADFRSFFALPSDAYTDIALRVRNPAEVTTVAQKGTTALPGYRFITKANIERTYEALFSWREGMLLSLLFGAVLAFSILAFDKASGLSARERQEIGILKAIGWETQDIIRMKLWEGALISVTAFMGGLVFAYAHVFFLSGALLEPVLKGWSALYPHFTLTPTIDILQLATLGFFTIVPYVSSILIPVWRTASADPDQMMR